MIHPGAAYEYLYDPANDGLEFISKHHGGCEQVYDNTDYNTTHLHELCRGTGGRPVAEYFFYATSGSNPYPVTKRWVPWRCEQKVIAPYDLGPQYIASGSNFYDCNGNLQRASGVGTVNVRTGGG